LAEKSELKKFTAELKRVEELQEKYFGNDLEEVVVQEQEKEAKITLDIHGPQIFLPQNYTGTPFYPETLLSHPQSHLRLGHLPSSYSLLSTGVSPLRGQFLLLLLPF
jgi:hypothetical protein